MSVQAKLFSISGKSVSVEFSIYKTIFDRICRVYFCSGNAVQAKLLTVLTSVYVSVQAKLFLFSGKSVSV